MRRLVVNLLNLLSQRSKEKGFTLFELVIVSVIIGVVSAVAAPNLIDSQRQETVKRTFSQIRSALVEAQVNANRMSKECRLRISNTINAVQISRSTGNPNDVGCLLETVRIDPNVVDITSSAGALPQIIRFDYTGRTSNAQTLQIRRKTFAGVAMPETGKCIVISSIGMIRTGIYNAAAPSQCENLENRRYVP